jgi:ABC-type uncharacterized transport system ATPase subunit
MLPARIKQPIFEALTNVLSTEDNTYINQYYQLDKNPLEHIYVLRPIDEAAKKEWNETEVRLQQILHCASDLCMQMKTISENDRNEFHISGELIYMPRDFLIHKDEFSDSKRNLSSIRKQYEISTTNDCVFSRGRRY